MSDEVGSVEPFLGDPFGGNDSDQGSYGPIGPVPSGPTPQPNPNQGPPGPPGPNIDRYAATRIVSTDPTQGTDTTIQGAILNLPPEGGKIFVKSPLTISTPIAIGDQDIEIEFAGNAVLSPQGDIEIFQFLNGLTKKRTIRFDNLKVDGDVTRAQTLFAFKDTNARAFPTTYNANVKGIRTLHDVQAGDVTFFAAVRMHHKNGLFIPTISGDGNNILAKSPSAAGSYAFPVSLTFDDCICAQEDPTTPLDAGYGTAAGGFDGDFIFDGSSYLLIAGLCQSTGVSVGGQLQLYQGISGLASVLEDVGGGSFDGSAEVIQCISLFADFAGITFKCSAPSTKITKIYCVRNGSLVLNAIQIVVGTIASGVTLGAPSAVGVDVLAGADDCSISGDFGDHSTAAIRTAAQRTRVTNCLFGASTGAHKTIVDSGAGDFTLGVGNTGVNAGGGMTLAANSRVIVGTGINLA